MKASPVSTLTPLLFLALVVHEGPVPAHTPGEVPAIAAESRLSAPAVSPAGIVGAASTVVKVARHDGSETEPESHSASLEAFLARQPTGLAVDERRRLARAILEESVRHGFDPSLVLAVIYVESRFQTAVVSTAGAVGLMQLRPATAKALADRLGVTWTGPELLLDPVVNVRLGTAYVKQLMDRFDDLDVALTAYNWGPTRIGRRIRRGETLPRAYVSSVMTAYQTVWQLGSEPS